MSASKCKTSLIGAILLGSISCFLYASDPSWTTSEQAIQTAGEKRIVVIFKGSKKDSAAKISLDGDEKGELTAGMYLAMPAANGSHTIAAGENTRRKIACERPALAGLCAGGSVGVDHLEANIHPASRTVVLFESQTVYLLIERNRLDSICCTVITTDPGRITDYKLCEIKAKEGEKLLKKYREIQ
jgi:hypothetical protein